MDRSCVVDTRVKDSLEFGRIKGKKQRSKVKDLDAEQPLDREPKERDILLI